MTDRVDMNNHDPRAIRNELGVDQNVLLAPQKPQPVVEEESLCQVLTHLDVFSDEECAKIIADSDAGWIEKNENNLWIFDKMLALVMAANQKFKFEVDFFEGLLLVKQEWGDSVNWHSDLGPGHAGNRKLTLSIPLGGSFTGGDLVVDNEGEDFVAPREVGSVTVFPSFINHLVTMVESGTRYSLVAWASGTQRFR